MYTKKLHLAALVLSLVGILVLWRIGIPHAVIAAPAPEARKVPKELLEKRRDAVQRVFNGKMQRVPRGLAQTDEFFGWSERLLEAELALSEQKENQITAFKAHLDRTREIERIVTRMVKAGIATNADLDVAAYERINAEIRYFQGTGKDAPQPPKLKLEEQQEPLNPPQEAKKKN